MRTMPALDAVELNGTHVPASGTAAIVTAPATNNEMWVADGMYCGFATTPLSTAVALISVAVPGTIFKVYVPRAKVQMLRFPRGLYTLASRDGQMNAVCGSGGVGRLGVCNLVYR